MLNVKQQIYNHKKLSFQTFCSLKLKTLVLALSYYPDVFQSKLLTQ